jgi:bilin biosynthesis protein
MPDPVTRVVDSSIVTAEVRVTLERLRQLAGEVAAALFDPEAGDTEVERAGRLLLDIGPAAVEPLVERLCADPRRGRDVAVGVLSEMGDPAVEALLPCFTHEDLDVRATAAFLFTALRDASGRAEQPLIRLLDDREELVRQSAAYALGAQGSHKAVPKLIALATRPVQMPSPDADEEAWADAYPYDTCAAVDALGQLGDLRAVRPLLFLVDSQGAEGPIYEEAVRALGLLGDVRGAQAVRQAFETTRSDGAFADVLAALFGQGAVDELRDLAESDDVVTRRTVCEELIRLGSPRAAATVASLLVDPDEDVRATARDALAKTADDDVVAEIIAGLEDPSPETRAFAADLLPIACAWSD